jgi:hypothetical protein
VLAGLAGAAGIAGTAQAVNLNPDGLGQVLIYPYYTTRDGNSTILSVVNTTDSAKAVKVRFKEGYNSREVLDFNLYMSAWDVWTATLFDDAGTPTMRTADTSCTVPYFYGNNEAFGQTVGDQEFLPFDYTGSKADGGPTTIDRAMEGHFEMIEMGTLTDASANPAKKRVGSATAATHVLDDDGKSVPLNCQQLVDNWSTISSVKGMWLADADSEGLTDIDVERNSGGLFGGAGVINVGNGTFFTYNAKAVQGFDKDLDSASLHYEPGSIRPNLNSGDQTKATIFFGVPQDTAVTLSYPSNRGVDAVSAVFMHEYTMNEFNQTAGLNAASEWIVTFPTKNWYVDKAKVSIITPTWIPKISDSGCGGWVPGEPYPSRSGPNPSDGSNQEGWELCTYTKVSIDNTVARPPFTDLFDGEACELFLIEAWDQEESPTEEGTVNTRPVVSPKPPPGTNPDPDEFAFCYEVNRMKVGGDDIFGASDLLYTLDVGIEAGWARIDWYTADTDHEDYAGLLGLPVTGYWAVQYQNGFLGTPEAGVLANYGGLFEHRGNVRRSYSGERPSPD